MSALASIAKAFMPQQTSDFLSWARERFGISQAMQCLASRTNVRGFQVVEVPLNAAPGRTVKLRLGTTDNTVYDQIFDEQEYAIDCANPRFIIDAGAHIGLTSVYFATKYPNAIIVAIEPDLANWTMARANTAQFPNVTVIRGALWNREAHLAIANPDASSGGFRVVEDMVGRHASADDNGLSLPGFTVPDLLRHFGQSRIDILKMDIEGSEVEVLPTVDMNVVGILACETHDRFKPGCTDMLKAATPGWSWLTRGDTHILRPKTA